MEKNREMETEEDELEKIFIFNEEDASIDIRCSIDPNLWLTYNGLEEASPYSFTLSDDYCLYKGYIYDDCRDLLDKLWDGKTVKLISIGFLDQEWVKKNPEWEDFHKRYWNELTVGMSYPPKESYYEWYKWLDEEGWLDK